MGLVLPEVILAFLAQPKTPPTNFTGANWTTGTPISDPYMLVNEPTVPALSVTNGAAGQATAVAYNVDGCPDHAWMLKVSFRASTQTRLW